MKDLNVTLLILGVLFLVAGGIGTILLLSVNNGVTKTLTETGYEILALCAGSALLGPVLILLALFTNKSMPQKVAIPTPVIEPIITCRVCGANIRRGQVYCNICGRALDWKNPQPT